MDSYKRAMLAQAQRECDDDDESTEFMIQYMQDVAGATYDEVMDFLQGQAE